MEQWSARLQPSERLGNGAMEREASAERAARQWTNGARGFSRARRRGNGAMEREPSAERAPRQWSNGARGFSRASGEAMERWSARLQPSERRGNGPMEREAL